MESIGEIPEFSELFSMTACPSSESEENKEYILMAVS